MVIDDTYGTEGSLSGDLLTERSANPISALIESTNPRAQNTTRSSYPAMETQNPKIDMEDDVPGGVPLSPSPTATTSKNLDTFPRAHSKLSTLFILLP